MFHVYFKRMRILFLLVTFLHVLRSVWFVALFMSSIFLVNFLSILLSVAEKRVLKSPVITVCMPECSVMSSSLQPYGVYVVHQSPLSMEFSRQEYRIGFPFSPPGDLPNPGIGPISPSLAGRSFTTGPPRKPPVIITKFLSLSLVIFFVLRSILSEIATPGHLYLLFTW